jgi:hypothetical protein
MSTVYERRIEQEWRLLQLLAETNPGRLEVGESSRLPDGQSFRCTLRQSPALLEQGGAQEAGLAVQDWHEITFRFPRFFPAVPIEASLARPVFHPNVHPENGFVCLWDSFSPGDTVIEAAGQLQRVISWQLVNERPDHLMQPRALEWYRSPNRSLSLPLVFQALQKPEGFELSRTYGRRPEGSRKRLS